MELGGIGEDGRKIRSDLYLDLDRTRESVFCEPGHFAENRFYSQRGCLAASATSKGKDLAHHLGAALGAAFYGDEQVFAILRLELFAKEFGGHEDRSKHVVEVMGDAA